MDSAPLTPSPSDSGERVVPHHRSTGVPKASAVTGPVSDEGQDGPPPAPEVARRLFGGRLALAEQYVALLADTGISHGLVGPRERPRLWDRHVLGCAVLTDVLPPGSRVVDIGSGAGLPGLVLAIRRPDLEVQLVEPLHRRVVWLENAVGELDLPNVVVREGRAESRWGGPRVDVVTARAVARIGMLAQWSLPLLEARGRLVALKGASAPQEVVDDAHALTAAGAQRWDVQQLGVGDLDPPATIVTVHVGETAVDPPRKGGGKRPAPRSLPTTTTSAPRGRSARPSSRRGRP